MHVSARWQAPTLFAIGFLVRTPLLALPLEGAGARLAAAGAQVAADGPGAAGDGAAWLLGACLAVLGSAPTPTLRVLEAVLAAALAPLSMRLGRDLGLGPRRAAAAGLAVAVHPLALQGAGGVQPGGATLAAVLVLAALALLGARTPVRRRFALLPLLLAGAAAPAALPFVPPLLWLQARREPGPRWQTAGVLLGLGACARGALAYGPLPGALASLADVALWLAVAAFGVGWWWLPRGLRAVADRRVGRAWLFGAALTGLGVLLGATGAVLAVLPLAVIATLRGVPAPAPVRARRVVAGALACGLAASILLVSGGLQAWMLPEDPPPAGRLHQLGEAVRAAAREVGDDGWIVLSVREDRPEEQASLGDLAPGRWTWAHAWRPSRAAALRAPHVFPAGSFEADRAFAVVAPAGTLGAIETFDGAGIYHQELVRRVGPYVVLRTRRP